MKKLIKSLVVVLMLSLFPITVHAADVPTFSAQWNDLTSDPWDDTISFTVPEAYRSYSNDSAFTFSADLNGTKEEIYPWMLTINASTGEASYLLSHHYNYGIGLEYSITISILDANNNAVATTGPVAKSYTSSITSLAQPKELYVNKKFVSFQKSFGATTYLIYHNASDGSTEKEAAIQHSYNSANLKYDAVAGDIITVKPVNGSLPATSASVTASAPVSITNLTWNDNEVSDPWDDTVTFTAPSGYGSNNSADYNYSFSWGESGVGLTTENSTVDAQGNITILLNKISDYGNAISYAYFLVLTTKTGSRVDEQTGTKTFTNSLTAPANPAVNDKTVSWDKTFGAVQYEVKHYSSNKTTLIETVTVKTNTATLGTQAAAGDYLEIYAVNGNTKSDAATVTAAAPILISNIAWVDNTSDPWDDSITFTAPEGYRSLTSSDYHYDLIVNSVYSQRIYNTIGSIDTSNGSGSAELKLYSAYGKHGGAYTITISLKDASENEITATSISKDFGLTALSEPQNIFAYGKTVSFDPVFGAEFYQLTISSTVNPSIINQKLSSTSYSLSNDLAAGDVITVRAVSGTITSASSYIVKSPITITDLSWDTNGTDDNIMDDSVVFSTPKYYASLDHKAGYSYSIYFVTDTNNTIGSNRTLDTSDATIDSENRIHVPLKGNWYYGKFSDYECYVTLNDDVHHTNLCESNHLKHSFTVTALSDPENFVTDTSGLLSARFDIVFGATKYLIDHYDSYGNLVTSNNEGTVKEGYVYYQSAGEAISTGDTIKVKAVREVTGETTLYSNQVSYKLGDVYPTEINAYPSPLSMDLNTDWVINYTIFSVNGTITDAEKTVTAVSDTPNVVSVGAYTTEGGATGYTVHAASIGTAKVTFTTVNHLKAVVDVTVTEQKGSIGGLGESNNYLGDNNNELQLSPIVTPDSLVISSTDYKSDHPEYASVDANGLVTLHAVGTATITVTKTTAHGQVITGTQVIHVLRHVESVTLDKTKITIGIGETVKLTPTILPADASTAVVYWTQGPYAEKITVDDQGNVTGVGVGWNSVIVNVDGKTATCEVTVVNKVTGLTIDKASTTTSIDQKQNSWGDIKAVFTPENATNQNVIWTSSNYDVLSIPNNADKSATQRIYAKAPGTVTITAVSEENPDFKDTIQVTVIQHVTGVTLKDDNRFNLIMGDSSQDTKQLTAVLYPTSPEPANKNVIWSSDNPDVAKVDSNGLVTAVSKGTATITVTTEDGGFTHTVGLTVYAADQVRGIEIVPSNIALYTSKVGTMGDTTGTLTVKFTPENPANKNVTWKSYDTGVVTIDANGNITAVAAGSTTIYATTEDGDFSASCYVTVKTPNHVQGITFWNSSINLEAGSSMTLKPTLMTEHAFQTTTDPLVTYQSSDESVATVDKDGKVTALKPGSTVITATADDGGYSDTITVIVPQHVTGVTIPETFSLQVYGSDTLTAVVAPETATNKTVSWTSSDTSIVSVADGTIYANMPGTAYITVTTADGGFTDTCKVTVLKPITEITLDNTELSLLAGTTGTLKATVLPENAENKNVSWSTDSPSVATVDANGVVTAVGQGTAVITATTEVGSLTATCTVTVETKEQRIKKFVTTLYSTTLDREPDEGGLNYWVNILASGKQTGAQVAHYFVFGKEFTAKNYCNEHFLTHLYRAIFSRDADADGLKYWEGKMSAGVTREAVLNGFLGGKEFKALCASADIQVGDMPTLPVRGTIQTWTCSQDGKMDNGIGNFVLRMYTKCLGREAEETGAAYWVIQLNTNKIGGTAVAEQFFMGKEFTNYNFDDSEYVERLYATIFGRDSDASGKNYWLIKMKNGMTRKDVLYGFAGGTEWANICKKYGIKK